MATRPATAPDTAPSAVGVPFCCHSIRAHAESGSSCGDRRRDEGGGCEFIGRQGAACIEPEPAEPEQRSAQDGEGQVVRSEGPFFESDSLSDQEGEDKGGDAGACVHDDTACEVQGAEIPKPSAHPPHPVTQGIVDKGRPEYGEGQKRGKLDPLGISPDDERRCDHRKHALKDHEGIMRDRCRVIGVGLPPHVPQTCPVEISDDSVPRVRTEGQGVSV